MKKGVNKAIIVGVMGQDPEVKQMTNGNCIATISIATGESWKDKNSGEWLEKTEWHRCVAFGKLAEIIGQHFRKGNRVAVEGAIATRKWQDQSGNDRYSTEIILSEAQNMSPKPERDQEAQNMSPQSERGQQPQQQAPQQQAPAPVVTDFEDNIPFN